jgi:hypothetical protein
MTINKIRNTWYEYDDISLDDDKLFYIVAILDTIIEDILNASLDRVYDKTGESPTFIDYGTVFDTIDNDYELNAVFNGNLYENYDDSDDDESDSDSDSDSDYIEKNPISKYIKTRRSRRTKRHSRRSKSRRSKNRKSRRSKTLKSRRSRRSKSRRIKNNKIRKSRRIKTRRTKLV